MGVNDGEYRVVWEIDDAVFQESGYVIYPILHIGFATDIQLVVLNSCMMPF